MPVNALFLLLSLNLIVLISHSITNRELICINQSLQIFLATIKSFRLNLLCDWKLLPFCLTCVRWTDYNLVPLYEHNNSCIMHIVRVSLLCTTNPWHRSLEVVQPTPITKKKKNLFTCSYTPVLGGCYAA